MEGLIRDPKKILKKLDIKDVITVKEELKIYIPGRFKNLHLLSIGTHVKTAGVFIITDGTHYAVSKVPGSIELTPAFTSEITYNDDDFLELTFPANTEMTKSMTVLMESDNLLLLVEEFVISGKVPWFLTQQDLLDLFLLGAKYVDAKIISSPKTIELLVSTISRTKVNPNIFARHASNTDIVFKGLKDVKYSYNNTVSKLTHNYFRRGLRSAMVSEQTESTALDEVLSTL